MNRSIAALLRAAALSLVAAGALAAAPTAAPAAVGPPPDDVPPEVSARIRDTLHERYPDSEFKHVYKSRIPGLYEVLTSLDVVYTNDTGTLAIIGRMVDTRTREDLTAQRWSELNPVDFDTLPLDLAVKVVRGNGKHKLAIFADPMCPYCHDLEKSLQELSDSTAYVFLFPLESIHPGAGEMSRKIWCAKDRGAAWSDWMLKNVPPPSVDCDQKPLETVRQLGEQLQVSSTPTLFLRDGQRLRGMPAKERLQKLLGGTG